MNQAVGSWTGDPRLGFRLKTPEKRTVGKVTRNAIRSGSEIRNLVAGLFNNPVSYQESRSGVPEKKCSLPQRWLALSFFPDGPQSGAKFNLGPSVSQVRWTAPSSDGCKKPGSWGWGGHYRQQETCLVKRIRIRGQRACGAVYPRHDHEHRVDQQDHHWRSIDSHSSRWKTLSR